MVRFWTSKLSEAAVTLFVLAFLVFGASRVSGDPIALLAPAEAHGTSIDRDELKHRLGLDGNIVEQFFRFINQLLHGNLGTSYSLRQPVWDLFVQRFPNTLQLVIGAFIFSIVVSIPLGVVAARRRGGIVDKVSSVVAVAGVSIPNFWLGIVLVLIFAVHLGWFPASRTGGLSHFVLPVLTLSGFLIGGMTRLVRSSLLEELDRDYVKLARTKGLSDGTVTWKHAFRNSLLPVTAFAATYASLMIGGAVAVEVVFAWPGLGQLLYQGVVARDYPLVQGIIVITGLMIVVINVAADLILAWLDPRIR